MSRPGPLLALVGVTAIWGVTLVQVQDALALYPLFAFLAVRFAISTIALAPFAWKPLRALPREGIVAGVGVGALLAAAYGFQTAGLELTTVSSTGFITGLYVVFTPLIRRQPAPGTDRPGVGLKHSPAFAASDACRVLLEVRRRPRPGARPQLTTPPVRMCWC